MKMKKTIAILGIALAIVACTKEISTPEVPASKSISDLVFDFTVRYPDETRAVKAGWENGDKVFVFFQGVTTGYLTLSYDGSWTPAFAGTATVEDLTESGSSFVAVYLPYGNDAAATYDSGWTFTEGKTDSYYLSASGTYSVTKADGLTTLSADLNMVVPDEYVQFFIPDEDAAGAISMACNAVLPAGVASISSDGVITETEGTQGAFMTGYAATVNSERGFYFSGKLADKPGKEYYFAIEMGDKHYDFYKHLETPLAARAAIKLTSKHQVGPGHYVAIGSTSWCTVNHTAEVPWSYTETKFNGWSCLNPSGWAGMGLGSSESIPDLDQMTELRTNTNEHRFGVSIGGVNGVLWVSASDETKYIFIPCSDSSNLGNVGFLRSSTKYNDSNAYVTRFYNNGHAETASVGNSYYLSVRTVLGPVNLSATATANTYIVSEPGEYRFKATVKGNGGLDPLTGTTATTIDPARIAGVKVLWELYGQGRAIRHDGSAYDISYSDGYVYFSTPDTFTPGDACVAIYDSEGTILWSWLIWATPEPGTMTHNDATFMDRNLGAIDVGNCMRGFCYQWGRKDAFSAADGNNYRQYTYVPDGSTVFDKVRGSHQSMEYTVQHPTTLIGYANDSTWMSEDLTTKPWRPDVKSIYDPCPAGWRVPTKENISGIQGLPATGIHHDDGGYSDLGNPWTGYYWSASTEDGVDDCAWAFCNDGRNLKHWGHTEGYAIRPVQE